MIEIAIRGRLTTKSVGRGQETPTLLKKRKAAVGISGFVDPDSNGCGLGRILFVFHAHFVWLWNSGGMKFPSCIEQVDLFKEEPYNISSSKIHENHHWFPLIYPIWFFSQDGKIYDGRLGDDSFGSRHRH